MQRRDIFMELVTVLIVAVFAAAALTECFFGFASIRSALAHTEERTAILIPVTRGMEDIEYVLRQAAKMEEQSDIYCRCIICNMGADGETLEICRRFAEEHGGFEIRCDI